MIKLRSIFGGVCALALSVGIFASLVNAKTLSVQTDNFGEDARECVVMLHGLARTSSSMIKLSKSLALSGFTVVNVDYPSREHPIETLSEMAVKAGVDACASRESSQIHFVTHSLGGILVRDYLSRHEIEGMKRVVMLAPPNHGSKVVDNLKRIPGFFMLNGPAGMQLGTGSNSIPLQLGPMNVETGIIAGTFSINLFLSNFLDNPDDGKVSVASTRVEGMCALLLVDASHTFIMKNSVSIEQTIHFLKHGRFSVDAEYLPCKFQQ